MFMPNFAISKNFFFSGKGRVGNIYLSNNVDSRSDSLFVWPDLNLQSPLKVPESYLAVKGLNCSPNDNLLD